MYVHASYCRGLVLCAAAGGKGGELWRVSRWVFPGGFFGECRFGCFAESSFCRISKCVAVETKSYAVYLEILFFRVREFEVCGYAMFKVGVHMVICLA